MCIFPQESERLSQSDPEAPFLRSIDAAMVNPKAILSCHAKQQKNCCLNVRHSAFFLCKASRRFYIGDSRCGIAILPWRTEDKGANHDGKYA